MPAAGDLNQVLTPYDVLCLKEFLDMPSGDFLETYTEESTGPGTGLPVVSLRFGDSDDLTCPFVTEAGCRVYPARPALLPHLSAGPRCLATAGHRAADGALGIDTGTPLPGAFKTAGPRRWTRGSTTSRLPPTTAMNDIMLELISLKKRFRSENADAFRKKTIIYSAVRSGHVP